jgi:hypothetical protein
LSSRRAARVSAVLVESPRCPAPRRLGIRVILTNVFMPTVSIPAPLLRSVDRRARALGISRNRLVIRALEQAVRDRSNWAPEFLSQLRRADTDAVTAVDNLVLAVRAARRSKGPRAL